MVSGILKMKRKMAEVYRCAVGPQLHRIFTPNSRQVGVEMTYFVDNDHYFKFRCCFFFIFRVEYFRLRSSL